MGQDESLGCGALEKLIVFFFLFLKLVMLRRERENGWAD